MNSLLAKPVAAILTAFIIVASLGCTVLAMDTAMGAMSSAPASGCVSMGGNPAVCQDVANHLSYWQQMLSTAIPPNALSLVLFVIGFLSLTLLCCRPQPGDLSSPKDPTLIGLLHTSLVLPRSALQEAFSNGILHSKAY